MSIPTQAMARFSRYVPSGLLEPIMFCKCSTGDEGCRTLQQQAYPKCLYYFQEQTPQFTCSRMVKLCQSEMSCRLANLIDKLLIVL